MLAAHVRHHAALGFDSFWQFTTHEWRRRLASAPGVASLVERGRLQWVSRDIGLPRVDAPWCRPTSILTLPLSLPLILEFDLHYAEY